MASLQARITKGKKYYSIVESFRDEQGKPRNRIIQYLGTTENIIEKLSSGKAFKSYSHGLLWELIKVAKEIDIVETVNRNIQNKKIKNGITAGASCLLSAFSRVFGDYSKRGWRSWKDRVSIETIMKKDFSNLDSDHFWQHMECIDDAEIEKIQIDIFKKAVTLHKCKPTTLLLDATNFFTYIDTGNQRCQIAQRGRNKQKRNDLRQVSSVLIVTKEELLPIYHSAYAGNINDVTMFKMEIEKILKVIRQILPTASLELIFDKGNLSKENLAMLDDSGYSYTTSVPRAWVKSILSKHCSEISKGQVVDCKEELWGKKRRFVIYKSKGLLTGQLRELRQGVQRVKKLTKEVNSQPEKRKLRVDKVKDYLANHKYAKQIMSIETLEDGTVKCTINRKKFKSLLRLQFGIVVLTTNTKAETVDVIKSYKAQYGVESAFSIMKNAVPFRPFYHWTDHKIKIHMLICLIAYILITMLNLKSKKTGCDYSVQKLIDKLESIRLVLSKSDTSTKFHYQLEKIEDDALKEVADNLGISGKNFRQKINGFSVYN